MRAFRITHTTRYAYTEDVAPSYGRLHLLPRDVPGQRCRSARVEVSPVPHALREGTDFHGNRVVYLELHEPHRVLEVTAVSEVEVDGRDATPSLFGDRPWEQVRDEAADDLEALEFLLDSPLVPAGPRALAYAAPSFPPGRHLLAAVTDLAGRIRADFAFRPGATTVTTPVDEVLDQRAGVCQDFAHLMTACLRSLGLPARYVSGYLETDPPPGREKLQGADVSHAWVAVRTSAGSWLEVDPTNDQLVDDRYVVVAFGRDYGDVPPVAGVIFTEGRTDELEVLVDVTALPA